MSLKSTKTDYIISLIDERIKNSGGVIPPGGGGINPPSNGGGGQVGSLPSGFSVPMDIEEHVAKDGDVFFPVKFLYDRVIVSMNGIILVHLDENCKVDDYEVSKYGIRLSLPAKKGDSIKLIGFDKQGLVMGLLIPSSTLFPSKSLFPSNGGCGSFVYQKRSPFPISDFSATDTFRNVIQFSFTDTNVFTTPKVRYTIQDRLGNTVVRNAFDGCTTPTTGASASSAYTLIASNGMAPRPKNIRLWCIYCRNC